MEKLKRLLSSLDDDSSVNRINATFSEIADILLFQSYIKTMNGNYRMMEIEFYFWNKIHEDDVTIKRTEKEGMWWLHDWGVDLTFKSESNKFYGGILIRSIIPFESDKPLEEKQIICGPKNCCWELFYSSALEADAAPQIVMNDGTSRHLGEMGTTQRYITGKTKRIDGDYRFYVKGLDLGKVSNYTASPWK